MRRGSCESSETGSKYHILKKPSDVHTRKLVVALTRSPDARIGIRSPRSRQHAVRRTGVTSRRHAALSARRRRMGSVGDWPLARNTTVAAGDHPRAADAEWQMLRGAVLLLGRPPGPAHLCGGPKGSPGERRGGKQSAARGGTRRPNGHRRARRGTARPVERAPSSNLPSLRRLTAPVANPGER